MLSGMVFSFRKLGRSIRLIPATKSLGYSTRINGDKDNGTYCKSQKRALMGLQGQSTELSPLSPSSLTATSSLIPLSVRDMALVLMPRLEGTENSQRPFDEFDPLMMNVSEPISFTSDDILPQSLSLNSPHIDKNLIMERFVVDIRHLNNDSDFGIESVVGENKFSGVFAPPQSEVKIENHCTHSEKDSRVRNDFETFFMKDTRFLSFNGLLFSSNLNYSSDKKEKSSKTGPSSEQLHSVKEKLEKLVYLMFTSRYDYSLLHKNVIFENQLFGENRIKRGQTAYALELLNLRFRIHTRFSSTAMEILNTTVHEENGVIRVHWRLKGLPQTEILKFWRLLQSRDEVSKDDWRWFEAFSYFHIGKDGLVHKHRIDRMLPGNDEPNKLSLKLRELLNPA